MELGPNSNSLPETPKTEVETIKKKGKKRSTPGFGIFILISPC
jgi:hypothetical protein